MSRADLACLLGVAAVYVVSREVLHGLGVQFDSVSIQDHWQVLPLELLQRELWTSVWYLHSQPPLFNVLLGLAFRVEAWPHNVLAAVFAMTAVSTLLLLFVLMRRWQVPAWLAFVVTIVVAMNPSFIGYEHWAFYTALEPCLLLAGAVAVSGWDSARGRAAAWWACGFGVSATALVLLRSLFHPVWAAIAAALVLRARSRAGSGVTRTQVAWALLPCAVGLALMTKNAAISGHFATSSWMGMNMSNMAFHALSRQDVETLSTRGALSPLYPVGAFKPLERYRPFADVIEPQLPTPSPTGIAALDVERPAAGLPNFNHLWYAGVSRVLMGDVRTIIAQSPAGVASVVWRALQTFCRPASDYGGISTNVQRIWPLEQWYRRVVYPYGSTAVVAVTLFGVMAWCAVTVLSLARPTRPALPVSGAVVYVAFAVLWVTTIGSVAEFGENNRFRFAIDPLMVAVVVAGATTFVRRVTIHRIPSRSSAATTALPV